MALCLYNVVPDVIAENRIVNYVDAIVLRDSGEVVGSIGLLASGAAHSECVAAGEFELGFWVGRPLWGQGIATEASQVLLNHCFKTMGARRVWASHYDYNHASARV